MPTDTELLREHVESGSEAAFAELVQRYAGLVYAAALRTVGGKAHWAEEVTQEVFIILARKAPGLTGHRALAGWLHTTTRYVALSLMRNLWRRENREREMVAMKTNPEPEIPWERVRPLLDEAVSQLNDGDRNAVLQRYFQGQSHREVGAALGLSEDTARVRTERAVEKLRRYFARKGVATTVTLLSEALTANAAPAAPIGLAGKVTAVARVKVVGLSQGSAKALYMTTQTKIAVAVVLAAFTAGWMGDGLAGGQSARRGMAEVAGQGAPANAAAPLIGGDALAAAKARLLRTIRTPGDLIREREMLDYVEKLDARTAEGLLKEFAANPSSWESQWAMGKLAYRWAELEPAAAVAWLDSLDDVAVKNACTVEIFDAYSAKEPAAALTAVAKLPGGSDSIPVMVITLINSARQDPAAALAALQSLPNSQKFDSARFIIFQEWAAKDPVAAAAAVVKETNGGEPTAVMRYVANTWAEQDPSAALAWARGLPAGFARESATGGALEALSQQDPAAAANDFLNLPASANHDMMRQTIVRNWAQEDPAGLLTWAADNLSGRPYDNAMRQGLAQLGQTDPVAAGAYLSKNLDADFAGQAVPALAGAWAQEDPESALMWAQSLPTDEEELRDAAIGRVLAGLIAIDPAAAADLVQQRLGSDPAIGAVASGLAGEWANVDAPAALKWAEGLPVGAQESAVVAAVAKFAAIDPLSAAKDAQDALTTLPSLTADQENALRKIAAAAGVP